MKKIFNVCAIIFTIVLLTGCFDKTNDSTNSNINAESDSNTTENSNQISNSNEVQQNNPTSNLPTSNITSNVTSQTQELQCTKTLSATSGVSLTQTNDIIFTNDKIDRMDMYMDVELNSNIASMATQYFDTLKTQYDNQFGKYEGVTVTVIKTSDTKGRITISFDFTKISSTDRTSMGISGSESYSVNKSSFENQGYTCR